MNRNIYSPILLTVSVAISNNLLRGLVYLTCVMVMCMYTYSEYVRTLERGQVAASAGLALSLQISMFANVSYGQFVIYKVCLLLYWTYTHTVLN